MHDIIDFVMKNAEEIDGYEITYYQELEDDGVIGEINFKLKNGDSENFFMC